jgi:hypothetical protein
MSNDSKLTRIPPDCKVCYVPHDDEIHEATLRIRHWLKRELTRKLGNGTETGQELEGPDLGSQVA